MTGNCQVLKSSGSFKECSFIFLSTRRFYSIYNYIFIYLILTLEREMASNPFQYSCLENPMDRGAWQAAVHGVSKSWLQLKWLSMHACNTDILSCIANKLLSVWLSASPTRFTEMRECLLWLLYPPQGCDVEENIYILKAQYKLKPTTLNSKYSQILALCESNDFLRGNKIKTSPPWHYGRYKGAEVALFSGTGVGKKPHQEKPQSQVLADRYHAHLVGQVRLDLEPVTFAKEKASSHRAPVSIKWDDEHIFLYGFCKD